MFLQVSNHGVDAAVIESMRAASREFFRQPLEEKQRYTNLISGERFQFEGYGNDWVNSPDQIRDWTDRLYLKVEPEDERRIALWPTHPENFKSPIDQRYHFPHFQAWGLCIISSYIVFFAGIFCTTSQKMWGSEGRSAPGNGVADGAWGDGW